MKTELIDKGDLSSQLTIVIEPEDYKSEFETELKKYGQKAHIKGFRKGKTPITAIKKMYGKSVLAEVINGKLQKTIESFITDEKLDILGNPLPSDDQKLIDFDLKHMEAYEFSFDIGHAPSLEVVGASTDNQYDHYKVTVEEGDIDEQLTELQKKMGEQIEVTTPIEILDIVSLFISEVNPVTEASFETEISIMPERMNEAYKDEYIGKEVGYEGQVDIFSLEKDTSEDYVKKYFLKDAPDDVTGQFNAKVTSIKRLQPAEINEDFFIKAFGEDTEVKTEEAARVRFREDLEKFYDAQGMSITKRKIMEALIEKNEMKFPDKFLKRWLLSSNEELNAAQLENEYEGFAQNLKWTLIKKELNEKYKIEISKEDIKLAMIEKFKAQFAQYGYGMMGEIDYDGFAERMMQNQESVQKEYEEILAERIMDRVVEEVSLVEKQIAVEEYKEIVEELRQNNG